MSNSKEATAKFLAEVNKKFKKKYGADILFDGNQVGNFEPFPTGFPTFDWINSGIGGFPRGGMTLIHGLESTGKSTFVLESIRYAMELDENITALYLDVENALTTSFLQYKNLFPDRLTITPINSEDALIIAEDAIKQNVFDIIVVDSLAKLESEKVMEKEMGESGQRNRRSVMITEFLRRTSFILRQSKTALVCINQEIQNQNKKTPYDPDTVLPGGMQQKYSANLRIELKRSKVIKDGDTKIGYKVSMTSAKNKISNKEKAMTYLTYLYSKGFIRELSLLDFLETIGKVKKLTMGRYEFTDKALYSGTFRAGEMASIAKKIKEAYGMNLYQIEPPSDISYEKNEKFKDVIANDESPDKEPEEETLEEGTLDL